MWDIVYSALSKAFNSLFTGGLIKVAFGSVLFWILGLLMQLVVSLIPALDPSPLIAQLPSGMLYLLAYWKVLAGLGIIFGALIARFVLRRIPVIG